MLIRYYGHSLFTLETETGTLIAFDPFNDHVGYPLPRFNPQIVLMSHAHSDHGNRELFPGAKVYLNEPGVYAPEKGVKVTGTASFHDDQQGALRGSNILFKVEADGLIVAHLGDLGTELNNEQLKALGRVDVLFIPVGGYYTIDGLTAKKVMEQVSPRITIPMHYKTEATASWPIGALDTFTRYFDSIPAPMPVLRVTKEDIACAAPVIVMER